MKNKVAVVLKSIAWWTFGLGFILGFFASSVEVPSFTSNFEYVTNTEFSLTMLLAIWGSSFVSGMLFLGFAEIIELLQQLVNRSVSKEQLEIIKIDEENYKKEKLYKELIRKKSIAATIYELNNIKSQFETIIDFKDVNLIILEIDEKIEKLQNDINVKAEATLKDTLLKQELKDKEIKIRSVKKEKRAKFFRLNSKKILIATSLTVIFVSIFAYKITNDQINLAEAEKIWPGKWRPYGVYTYDVYLNIRLDEKLVDICIPELCENDIKVNFDVSNRESLSFKIDNVTYELILKTPDIATLKYNETERKFKRGKIY